MAQAGFPRHLLNLVRCSSDGGELAFVAPGTEAFVAEGTVRCAQCRSEYHVRDGVLSLLRPHLLHSESAHEVRLRDAENESILAGARSERSSAHDHAVEIEPTLSALHVGPGMVVGELGCGSGRYTVLLAERAAAVMAVDFSLAALRVLRQKLGAAASVGLVQADVTCPYAGPRVFDRVLSTLHSNLPGRDGRIASLGQLAGALKEDGRAVISMHHYSLRDAVYGTQAAGRYREGGIYRYFLRRAQAIDETRPFFGSLRLAYLVTDVPRVRNPRVARFASNLPIVRGSLARLFLALVSRPKKAAEPR